MTPTLETKNSYFLTIEASYYRGYTVDKIAKFLKYSTIYFFYKFFKIFCIKTFHVNFLQMFVKIGEKLKNIYRHLPNLRAYPIKDPP